MRCRLATATRLELSYVWESLPHETGPRSPAGPASQCGVRNKCGVNTPGQYEAGRRAVSRLNVVTAKKQEMGRRKSRWQEKRSLQGLHQIHQAPNLSAHAVSTPIPSRTLQTLLGFIAGPACASFAARSAWGRVLTQQGGLCGALAGLGLSRAPLGMLQLGKKDWGVCLLHQAQLSNISLPSPSPSFN